MTTYDLVVVELNVSRLRGASFPIVHVFIQATLSLNPDVHVVQCHFGSLFHTLCSSARIRSYKYNWPHTHATPPTPPGIPLLVHADSHILNTPPLEHRYARAPW
jgi:nuclear pore complex protein Nup93